MTVYYSVLAAILPFSLLIFVKNGKEDKKRTIIFIVLTSAMLFAVSALRLNVGYDYPTYARSFTSNAQALSSGYPMTFKESGFGFIYYFTAIFTPSFVWMFALTSLIYILLFSDFSYRFSQNAAFSVLMFYCWGYFFNTMNFMRQMIAALIFIYAIQYAYEKRILRSLVFVLLAATFHFSAILMIPFLFLFNIKLNKITLAVYTFFTVLSFCFSEKILDIFTTHFYTNYSIETNREMLNGTSWVYPLIFSVVFIVGFIERKELFAKDKFNNVLLNLAFFNFFFELIGAKHAIISRMGLYCGVGACVIMLPRLLNILFARIDIKGFLSTRKMSFLEIRAVILIFVIFSASIAFFVYALNVNYNGVLPYSWIGELQW